MKVLAVVFTCAVLLISLSSQGQTAPSAPAQDKPCTALPDQIDINEILSDTRGVDFHPYLGQILRIVRSSWNPLIPDEVGAPFHKVGEVVVCFKILPSGRLVDSGIVLGKGSGDAALDRAARGAIETSVFPPLPADFKGPYLALRFDFRYNMDQKPTSSRKVPKHHKQLPGPGLTLGYSTKL